MKILILNWRCPFNPQSGGAEKVTLEHAKVWVRRGHEVIWVSGNYVGGHNSDVINGVKIVRYVNPVLIYFTAPFIYWLKFGGNFDLVFDEIHGLPFLSPLWAWKSKKIAYIHEVAKEIWDDMLPFPINSLGKLYEKIYFYIYRKTHFLTGSKSTKSDLVNYGVPKDNITVIPHGLFIKPLTKIPKKGKQLTLLYVSRLVKMKGIEEAIAIFAQIRKHDPESQFWIAGKGNDNYIRKLHKVIEKFGLKSAVHFLGYVDEEEKVRLYRRSHFLLHTSVREGFGLVVIEANSQGTPILGFNSPGLKDTIKNGINGYVFSKNLLNRVSDTCMRLYTNKTKYKKLSESSINYSKKYDWKEITDRSSKIIENI